VTLDRARVEEFLSDEFERRLGRLSNDELVQVREW
jgi:hypothetical protein